MTKMPLTNKQIKNSHTLPSNLFLSKYLKPEFIQTPVDL